ncbi:cuticle protein 7-like [Cherax quadricarinatus]|nr:cuticle protein 7-like [Cherax quadricarinatus]
MVGVVVAVGINVAVSVTANQPSRALYPRHSSSLPPSDKQSGSYNFQYGVKDDQGGAHFGQDETYDGHLIKGSYYIALPDGRMQTVKYQADHVIGYVADVEFDGEAVHPITRDVDPITFKSSFFLSPTTVPVAYSTIPPHQSFPSPADQSSDHHDSTFGEDIGHHHDSTFGEDIGPSDPHQPQDRS